MTTASTTLFDRPDTFFGVCEGIGRDMGFNPNWLRIVLGVSLLWNPVVVLAIYATLGVAVYGSRMVFPVDRLSGDVATPPAATVASMPVSGNDDGVVPVADAA